MILLYPVFLRVRKPGTIVIKPWESNLHNRVHPDCHQNQDV
jgi:hypothetical protein